MKKGCMQRGGMLPVHLAVSEGAGYPVFPPDSLASVLIKNGLDNHDHAEYVCGFCPDVINGDDPAIEATQGGFHQQTQHLRHTKLKMIMINRPWLSFLRIQVSAQIDHRQASLEFARV